MGGTEGHLGRSFPHPGRDRRHKDGGQPGQHRAAGQDHHRSAFEPPGTSASHTSPRRAEAGSPAGSFWDSRRLGVTPRPRADRPTHPDPLHRPPRRPGAGGRTPRPASSATSPSRHGSKPSNGGRGCCRRRRQSTMAVWTLVRVAVLLDVLALPALTCAALTVRRRGGFGCGDSSVRPGL